MSVSYIRLPRSFLKDPLWINLKPIHQYVFMVILTHMAYEPYEFDDHGFFIHVQPGQLCISERDFQTLCGKHISRIQIQRSYQKLRGCHFLSLEVRHRKTLITVIRSDICELLKTEVSQEVSQSRAKLEPQSIKVKKEHIKNTKVFSSDSVEIGLASLLFSSIQKKFPEHTKNPNLQKWAIAFDRMIRIDKVDVEAIREIINWLYSPVGSHFWSKNVLSADTFREKWHKLLIEKNNPAGKQSNSRANLGGERQTEYDYAY